jgi:periodic tryptophan protein 1
LGLGYTEDSDNSDAEDDEIRQSDCYLLTANTEDDFSFLQAYVYEEEDGNLYVHHDITLPAFPLCLAWMDLAPRPLTAEGGSADFSGAPLGSFVAVGTFKPGIEIWNLDVMDPLEPDASLGGEVDEDTLASLQAAAGAGKSNKKKNKKKKKKALGKKLKAGSHTDAVMCLDWNKEHRNILASGSADKTVKLWDITTQQCSYTFNHHTSKVQSVKWHPTESTVIASAAFDHKAVVLDGRQEKPVVATFDISADAECLTWNPHDTNQLVVSCEDGNIHVFDLAAKKCAFEIKGHVGAVSAVSFAPRVPGMLATAGVDKSVRIWDVTTDRAECVASKSMGIGEIYCAEWYKDSPFLLASGGAKDKVALWEVDESEVVERRFASRVVGQQEGE